MKIYTMVNPNEVKKIITYPKQTHMLVFFVNADAKSVEDDNIFPFVQDLVSTNSIDIKLAAAISNDYPNQFKDLILEVPGELVQTPFVLHDTGLGYSTKAQRKFDPIDVNTAILNSYETHEKELMTGLIDKFAKLESLETNPPLASARAVCVEAANNKFNHVGIKNSLNQNPSISRQNMFMCKDTYKAIQSHRISHFNCDFKNVANRDDGRTVELTLTSDLTDKEQLFISNAEKQSILKCRDVLSLVGILNEIPNGNWLAQSIQQTLSEEVANIRLGN